MVQECDANPYRDLFLLVDEWHLLFNTLDFRSEAIQKLLEAAARFERVTYMSATPVSRWYILEQLQHMPQIEIQ